MPSQSGLLPYGDTYTRHRKLLYSVLNKNIVTQYRPVQQQQARWYLQALLEKPEDFFHNLRLYVFTYLRCLSDFQS